MIQAFMGRPLRPIIGRTQVVLFCLRCVLARGKVLLPYLMFTFGFSLHGKVAITWPFWSDIVTPSIDFSTSLTSFGGPIIRDVPESMIVRISFPLIEAEAT